MHTISEVRALWLLHSLCNIASLNYHTLSIFCETQMDFGLSVIELNSIDCQEQSFASLLQNDHTRHSTRTIKWPKNIDKEEENRPPRNRVVFNSRERQIIPSKIWFIFRKTSITNSKQRTKQFYFSIAKQFLHFSPREIARATYTQLDSWNDTQFYSSPIKTSSES